MMNKRQINNFLSLFLCLILLFCSVAVAGADGEPAASECPVIFVKGFASSPILDISGEQLFPPDVSGLLKSSEKELRPIIRGVISGDYSLLREPVNRILDLAIQGIAFDENGDPIAPTRVAYINPTPEELAEKKHENTGYTAEDPIFYCFDWRQDLRTLAAGLNEFIEYVLENTGAEKVRIIASSMGTCVLVTYLHDYDFKNVRSFVLLEGAVNGVSAAGKAFCGELELDAVSAVRFFDAIAGTEFGGMLVKALLNAAYQVGYAEKLIGSLNGILAEIYGYLIRESLGRVFARFPGMWALVPYESYDKAMEVMGPTGISDELKAKTDYYHNEIQANLFEITESAKDSGINFAVVAKYGYMAPPVAESEFGEIGDLVIGTGRESFGAVCAKAGSALEPGSQTVGDGHDHMSADGMIDASTCRYPENTWFLKNINHMDHPVEELAFCEYLLSDGAMKTVSDNESYPQFLIYNDDGLVPLTADNDYSRYEEPVRSQRFFDRVRSFFAAFIAAIRVLFKR